MKKLTPLFILAILLSGCSTESIDSEELIVADAKPVLTTSEVVDDYATGDLYQGNLKATFEITNDCDNIILTIALTESANIDFEAGETLDIKIGQFTTTLPTLNNGGNLPDNLLQTYEIGSPEDLVISFPYDESITTYSFFIKGFGDYAGEIVYGKTTYFKYAIDLELCNDDSVCTYGKGWWRNHSNDNPGNQENLWPVDELMLGNLIYSQTDINTIMDTPVQGNGLVSLAQHLATAKLNILNGVDDTLIASVIEDADEMIGDLVVLEDSLSMSEVGSLKDALEAFNNSNSCDDSEGDTE